MQKISLAQWLHGILGLILNFCYKFDNKRAEKIGYRN